MDFGALVVVAMPATRSSQEEKTHKYWMKMRTRMEPEKKDEWQEDNGA